LQNLKPSFKTYTTQHNKDIASTTSPASLSNTAESSATSIRWTKWSDKESTGNTCTELLLQLRWAEDDWALDSSAASSDCDTTAAACTRHSGYSKSSVETAAELKFNAMWRCGQLTPAEELKNRY
jgi:hypothetical protein